MQFDQPDRVPLLGPKIDCLPIDSMDSEEWVAWGWPDDVTEVAANYEFASDTLTMRYSVFFRATAPHWAS